MTSFKCSQCGEHHDGWPALAYGAPLQYSHLNEEERNTIATFNDDFCIIRNVEQTDRFIRTALIIPVNNFDLNLEYGLWVSLSEKSFKDYADNYDRIDYETTYFGWICNNLMGYESSLSIPTDVNTQTGDHRPLLHPHEDHEHPLVEDFVNGITKEEAEKRIHEMMKAVQ